MSCSQNKCLDHVAPLCSWYLPEPRAELCQQTCCCLYAHPCKSTLQKWSRGNAAHSTELNSRSRNRPQNVAWSDVPARARRSLHFPSLCAWKALPRSDSRTTRLRSTPTSFRGVFRHRTFRIPEARMAKKTDRNLQRPNFLLGAS